MNDLTVSNIERQNVLNNKYAIANIQNSLGITGMLFEDEYRFTKKMVADFYEVDERTIERYIEQFADELSANGYILCKGNDPFFYPAIKLDSGEEILFACNKKQSRQLLDSQEFHVQLTLEKTADNTLVLKKWKKLKK